MKFEELIGDLILLPYLGFSCGVREALRQEAFLRPTAIGISILNTMSPVGTIRATSQVSLDPQKPCNGRTLRIKADLETSLHTAIRSMSRMDYPSIPHKRARHKQCHLVVPHGERRDHPVIFCVWHPILPLEISRPSTISSFEIPCRSPIVSVALVCCHGIFASLFPLKFERPSCSSSGKGSSFQR